MTSGLSSGVMAETETARHWRRMERIQWSRELFRRMRPMGHRCWQWATALYWFSNETGHPLTGLYKKRAPHAGDSSCTTCRCDGVARRPGSCRARSLRGLRGRQLDLSANAELRCGRHLVRQALPRPLSATREHLGQEHRGLVPGAGDAHRPDDRADPGTRRAGLGVAVDGQAHAAALPGLSGRGRPALLSQDAGWRERR